jgi:hypothetical protein
MYKRRPHLGRGVRPYALVGAASRTECVQTLPEAALELMGPHGRRLPRRTVTSFLACLVETLTHHGVLKLLSGQEAESV